MEMLRRLLNERAIDPEMMHLQRLALAKYPMYDEQTALMKYLQRSSRHSEEDARHDDQEIAELKSKVASLEERIAALEMRKIK